MISHCPLFFFLTYLLLLLLSHAHAHADPTSVTTTIPLIPHHVHRERILHRRQLDTTTTTNDDSSEVAALYHGFGTHYVDLWCGTPPQRQTVIVDTGSSVTAFPCKDCQDCGGGKFHTDPVFDETQSSSFSKMTCATCERGSCVNNEFCKISMSYQEGSSWTAFEAKDMCYVGGPHVSPAYGGGQGTMDPIDPQHANALTIPLDFGCQTKLTGLFKTQLADGIMGMEDDKASYWSQVYQTGKMGQSKQFSLCFSRPLGTERSGTLAGAMTLGGTDERLHDTPMVYATRTNHHGFYNVRIRKVYLRDGKGGESALSKDSSAQVIPLDISEASLNKRSIIIDSGTTDTYLNRGISIVFRNAFSKLAGRSFDIKRTKFTQTELEQLPTILIQLTGDVTRNSKYPADTTPGLAGSLDSDNPYDVIVAIPPSHYLEGDVDKKGKFLGTYTQRVYDNEAGGSVLGANTIMGHDVLFDLDDSVIGWSESSCDYHSLVTKNGYKDVLDASDPPPPPPKPSPPPSSSSGGDTNGSNQQVVVDDDTTTFDDDDDDTKKKDDNDNLPPPSFDIDSNSHDIKKDLKDEFSKVSTACTSWYCRGGLILSLLLMLGCGCCFGMVCCGRSSSSGGGYERAVALSDGSFSINGKRYKDVPIVSNNNGYVDADDAEYGEFEMNGAYVDSR